jgi:signal transduction histidine kinase
VEIALTRNRNRLILGVEDNGIGMPEKPGKTKGMGLRLMQYRAGVISGSLVVQRNPEGGTTVVCSVTDAAGPDQKAKANL